MNSYDKPDSGICKGGDNGIGCSNCAAAYRTNGCTHSYDHSFQIGKNDYELIMKLAMDGFVYGKFRRMISVYVDITAPLYWWKEFDTYKAIQLLPSSDNQKRTLMLNYEVLAIMYEHQRNLKLDGWCEFCPWIEGLPWSDHNAQRGYI